MIRLGLLALLGCLAMSAVQAAESVVQPVVPAMPVSELLATEPEMNDIRLSSYADFQDQWKLVTVRYRIDTQEMRFTYANSSAYAALIAGGKDYPDGAVFGKIGLMTEDDPVFTSSKVPSGAQRIQLMVRDKSKYAATGGWGYAVFGPTTDNKINARSSPKRTQELAGMTNACFSCHQIVKSRNYVFSLPADLTTSYRMIQTKRAMAKPSGLGVAKPSGLDVAKPPVSGDVALSFVDHGRDDLPEAAVQVLPSTVVNVRFLEGYLREHVFVGTFGEIRPTLVAEVARSGMPAIFVAQDGVRYVLVLPEKTATLPNGHSCPAGQKVYSTYSDASFNNIERYFCN